MCIPSLFAEGHIFIEILVILLSRWAQGSASNTVTVKDKIKFFQTNINMASGLSPPTDLTNSIISRQSDDSAPRLGNQLAMNNPTNNVGGLPFLVVRPGVHESQMVSTPGNSSDSFSSGRPMQVDAQVNVQNTVIQQHNNPTT